MREVEIHRLNKPEGKVAGQRAASIFGLRNGIVFFKKTENKKNGAKQNKETKWNSQTSALIALIQFVGSRIIFQLPATAVASTGRLLK